MDERIIELSKYRLNKAFDDLDVAEIMLEKNKLAQSVNRSYYSIFHATRAILALDKFDSKKHSGIIAYFNKNYIKENIIEEKYGQMLMQAEQIRRKSDYDDFYIVSKEQAQLQFENAKMFVLNTRDFLNKKLIDNS